MTIPIGLRTTSSAGVSGKNEKRIETDQDSRATSSPPFIRTRSSVVARCAARSAAGGGGFNDECVVKGGGDEVAVALIGTTRTTVSALLCRGPTASSPR